MRTPPVAISLIAVAPARISSRTAARTASGAVDLPRERDAVAMTAGDRERAPGREDPRPRDEPGSDGPSDVDARAAHPAEVAHGGHARVEVPLGVHHGLQRREPGRGEVPRLLLEVRARRRTGGARGRRSVPAAGSSRRPRRLAASRASFGARGCAPTHSIPSAPKSTPWRFLTLVPVEDRHVRDVGGLRHHSIMPPARGAPGPRSRLTAPEARAKNHEEDRCSSARSCIRT